MPRPPLPTAASSLAPPVRELVGAETPAESGIPDGARRRAGVVALGIAGMGALAATAEVDAEAATWAGIEGRPCTLRAVLGDHACPGCGMTRSVALTVQGEPGPALALHPAGPLFVGYGLVTGLLAAVAWRRGRRFAWERGVGLVLRTGLLTAVAAVGVLRWMGEIG